MVFDKIMKWIGKSKPAETQNHKLEVINEELDEFEREIQEYIHYSEERGGKPEVVSQPKALSQGGGRTNSSLITPEEEKRIEN